MIYIQNHTRAQWCRKTNIHIQDYKQFHFARECKRTITVVDAKKNIMMNLASGHSYTVL